MRAEPRPLWPEWEKAVHDFACRSMHAMNARLFTKRLARKKASGRQKTGIKKPLVMQRQCEGLMNLAECRTITAQRLPFPGRFG